MIKQKAESARIAMRKLAQVSSDVRNGALLAMADQVWQQRNQIIEVNQIDLENGRKTDLALPLMKRLSLNEEKISTMADNLRQVASLPEPIGEVTRTWERPNGLQIGVMRVPIGLIGVIYESRPNVTVEVSALCLKSGNGVILRGGSEAIHSNMLIAETLRRAAEEFGLKETIQFVEITDREAVRQMISMHDLIDLIVPRGSQEFIRYIMKTSEIPVVGHADGICHVYVDQDADLKMAEKITVNAKTQYVAVCNAMETMLVHENIADKFLPVVAQKFADAEVELRGCGKARRICPDLIPASDEDWRTEYLDSILSVRVVTDLDEAIDHIETYGSHHSDAIVTNNYTASQRFLKEVDSAAVYVNASTRFTDGYEFGLGAEVGVSTQKLHCRGPMGLEGLTSYKYIIRGTGQIK
ncbi:MAG: glutamate-5-semialdehyde dehydrogenase [Candidatus Poribacteria bacterium]